METGSDSFVSVIVPAYRSMSMLPQCVEALQRQTYPAYEVIVVDNGHNAGIEALCGAHPKVKLLRHAIPGSYSSRNAGLAIAKGEIIALTDADCVPRTDWVQKGVTGLQRNCCRMGGGRILPFFARAHRPTTIELCDVVLHTMDQEQSLRECTSIACANMFVHRSLFDTIGPFNDALFSAGDCEFTYRVRRCGEDITYMDDAIVFHRARRTLKELSERYRRFAGAEFISRADAAPSEAVRGLRSLSFRYRLELCIRNIIAGTRRHRKEKHPLVLLPALLFVESYITIVKAIEYGRLSIGMPMHR